MAQALSMEVNAYIKLYNKIVITQSALQNAVKAVDLKMLTNAIWMADQFHYQLADYSKAKALKETVEQFTTELDFALKYLQSREQLRDLSEKCGRVRLNIEQVAKVKEYLKLSETEFLKAQLKAANVNKDQQRQIALSIKMKELFFVSFGDSFTLKAFAQLKAPDKFAKAKMFGKENLKSDMMVWTKSAIPTSLTVIEDPALQKIAVQCFKNLVGYMGDRQINYPSMLACEILDYAIKYPILRDEIYLQVIKQLTSNPSEESETKGWDFMKICLHTFPPSLDFENFLEVYLRRLGKNELRELLHKISYTGPVSKLASPEEMIEILDPFYS